MNEEIYTPSFRLKPARVRNEFPRKRKRLSYNAYLLKIFNPKTSVASRGSNARVFSVANKREQRCIVKISYTKNTKSRSWAAHGEYLQREHAQETGIKGRGFSFDSNDIDIKEMLREWQTAGDEHMFRLIISPENGHRMNLQAHTLKLVMQMEKDLKTKLTWAAIDHHNTEHSHIHLLIRGIDDKGQTLRIDSQYLSHVIRHHSQELATRELGLRKNHEMQLQRSLQIERMYMTDLDKSIIYKSKDQLIHYHSPVPHDESLRQARLNEIGRLKFLETIGLATQIDKKAWKLSDKMESTLRCLQLSNYIIKARYRHGIRYITHQPLIPTEIKENEIITGKIVGMGLEQELHDKRYLILESIDGKVHYLHATHNIVKARDNFEMKNGDVISLEKKPLAKHLHPNFDTINIKNHGNFQDITENTVKFIDEQIFEPYEKQVDLFNPNILNNHLRLNFNNK